MVGVGDMIEHYFKVYHEWLGVALWGSYTLAIVAIIMRRLYDAMQPPTSAAQWVTVNVAGMDTARREEVQALADDIVDEGEEAGLLFK